MGTCGLGWATTDDEDGVGVAEVLTVRRDQGGEDGREAVCRPAGSLQKDEAGPIDMASGIGFLNGSGS